MTDKNTGLSKKEAKELLKLWAERPEVPVSQHEKDTAKFEEECERRSAIIREPIQYRTSTAAPSVKDVVSLTMVGINVAAIVLAAMTALVLAMTNTKNN